MKSEGIFFNFNITSDESQSPSVLVVDYIHFSFTCNLINVFNSNLQPHSFGNHQKQKKMKKNLQTPIYQELKTRTVKFTNKLESASDVPDQIIYPIKKKAQVS